MFEALRGDRMAEYYDSLVLRESEIERGIAEGRIVRTRACATLFALSRPRARSRSDPTLVDDATYAVEAEVLGEADVVRLQRRLDTLENRLLTLELRLPTRVYRRVARTAKRALRRG